MILAPPPEMNYDTDLEGWLHRLSVAANKDAAVLTIDTANTRIGVGDSTPSDTIDAGGIVRATGFRCREGTSGDVQAAFAFDLSWEVGVGCHLWIGTSDIGVITVTSDYRLKKDIKPLAISALDRIAKLRPVTYRWNDSNALFVDTGHDIEGFIAHEVQDIIPSAVHGDKDKTDKDGNQRNQSFNILALVATLTKGIQELATIVQDQAALIVDLQKRVEQLEKKQP